MTLKPSDFWYTPSAVLDAVKAFMPDYFDPCPINPTFDGLGLNDQGHEYWWSKDCFINPPYSETAKKSFIDQGIRQFIPNESRYIWLMNYANSRDLWELHRRATAVCIPQSRVKFIPGHPSLSGHPENPDPKRRKKSGPMYDNIFILWGDTTGFAETFKNIGKVYTYGN